MTKYVGEFFVEGRLSYSSPQEDGESIDDFNSRLSQELESIKAIEMVDVEVKIREMKEGSWLTWNELYRQCEG